MRRSERILDLCRRQRDREVIDCLEIPLYDSTKTTNPFERNLFLNRCKNLMEDYALILQDKTVSTTESSGIEASNSIQDTNAFKELDPLLDLERNNKVTSSQKNVESDLEEYEYSSEDYIPSDVSDEDVSEEIDLPSDVSDINHDEKESRNIVITSIKNPKLNEGISYSQTKKTLSGTRLRDKLHCCYICSKMLKNNIARHFENVHAEDTQVARILILPKKSRSRRKAFESLVRTGDFYYNCNVLSIKEGELILVRRPDNTKEFQYNDFGPCPHCLGFMSKKYLWHHIKYGCSVKKTKNITTSSKKGPMAESCALIFQSSGKNVSLKFIDDIIKSFRSDHIAGICKEDNLILNIGHFIYEKYGSSQSDLIRQSMRQLGKLTKTLMEIDNSSTSLSGFICPEKFDVIVTATKKLCGCTYDEKQGRHQFDTPSLALKIGHLLRKCIALERGMAIRKGDLKRSRRLESLSALFNLEWATRVSTNALATMYKRKVNAKQLLPVTSDLLKLTKHLDEQISKLKQQIKSGICNRLIWSRLASVTLSKIILFNKRSGEASHMTLDNYLNISSWGDHDMEEIQNSLTSLEQQLAARLVVVQIIGKRGRKVPVILTDEVKMALDSLMSTRKQGEINENNHYIFARSSQSLLYLRGHDCLKRECVEANLSHPQNITSTKLRKYTATVCQIFNLKENELDWLARHLGHDIRIHRDFYRLHENTIEMTKVGRLLMVLDQGQAHKFTGMGLDSININDLPGIESEEENSDEEERIVPFGLTQTVDENILDQFNNDNIQTEENLPEKMVKCVSQKRQTTRRQQWSTEEKHCVFEYFDRLIKKRILPGKKQCEECIEKHSILHKRKWTDIKFCLKNHIHKINKKTQ